MIAITDDELERFKTFLIDRMGTIGDPSPAVLLVVAERVVTHVSRPGPGTPTDAASAALSSDEFPITGAIASAPTVAPSEPTVAAQSQPTVAAQSQPMVAASGSTVDTQSYSPAPAQRDAGVAVTRETTITEPAAALSETIAATPNDAKAPSGVRPEPATPVQTVPSDSDGSGGSIREATELPCEAVPTPIVSGEAPSPEEVTAPSSATTQPVGTAPVPVTAPDPSATALNREAVSVQPIAIDDTTATPPATAEPTAESALAPTKPHTVDVAGDQVDAVSEERLGRAGADMPAPSPPPDEVRDVMDGLDLPAEEVADVEQALTTLHDTLEADPELQALIADMSEDEIAEVLDQLFAEAGEQ